MAKGYKEELETELKLQLEQDPDSHASRLLTQELERLDKGEDEKKEKVVPFIDVHPNHPQPIGLKIRIPIREHPRYNFVGKLLGPKGATLKALQEQTGVKMAIMGRGSMRDKEKEEECRKEGGKYAHLNEELHILVECFAEMTDGYARLSSAVAELKKFLIPDTEEHMGPPGFGDMNGQHTMGRGGFRGAPRGAPPERGMSRGRGGFGGGRGAPPAAGRGVPPAARGAPPSRGGRGAPSGRGAPPPPLAARGRPAAAPPPAAAASSYDSYGGQGDRGYGSSYDEGYGAGDGYSSSYSQSDSQFYDYGHGSSSQGSYGGGYSGSYDYEGGAGYSSGGWSGAGGKAAPPTRGAARGASRSHPYAR